MKTPFYAFILTFFLFLGLCPQPAQARPPVKQLLKAFSQCCEGKLSALSNRVQQALTRRSAISQAQAAKKAPLFFNSLEHTSAYYARMHRLPAFPLPEQETELYRGMTLDATGQQLRHILKQGLEVSKTHSRNFAAYDGRQYPDNQKAIYATPDLKLALSFALEGTRFDDHIPVIIHLKRVSNERIVSIPHDVPLSWIHRVSALLIIKGHPVWGEIRLAQDERFVFLPYPKHGAK